MKITRRQLRQIIKEELKSMQVISEVSLSHLEEEVQEDIIFDVYTHVLKLIEDAWPKADHVPGGVADADLSVGGPNQFTLTYEFMTIGTGTGLAGLRKIRGKWNRKVSGKAKYKSTEDDGLDNTGNRVFRMKLAKEDPIKWSSKEGKRKDSDGYVSLTVLITLNRDYVADHEPIDGL